MGYSKAGFLYELKDDSVYGLDDLGKYKKLDVDKTILIKFLEKYKGVLEKEPLGLCNIEKIYFLYPYSLGYGYPKTNIAKLIQIAKTGDLGYCNKVFSLVKDSIYEFAKKYDKILFVPYSVERKCNVLNLLKDYLKNKGLNIVETYRVKPGNEIKNIKSLKEKFKIASEKFDVEKINYESGEKVLIIDDMVNTGASMCAIANKLPNNIKIDGLSIVGSLTNEIISDI